MLSIRPLARSAPRALSLAARASTTSSSFIARRSAVAALSQTSRVLGASRYTAGSNAFSTTAGQRAAAGETDEELSAKLESEIQIEEDMKAEEQQPASIKDFLDNSPFELVDSAGQEIVKLVRSFGEERITVSFSVADLSNFDPYQEDPSLEEDELNDEVAKQGSASAAEAEDLENEMDDLADESAAPITLNIVIEKPGKTAGALNIDATAQDGAIVVENMFFYEDAGLARAENPEAAQRRAEVYPGPPFGSLDEDLQVMMERFLEERGVTPAMAVFVPDYVDFKEQREYLRWLNNVKAFVDA